MEKKTIEEDIKKIIKGLKEIEEIEEHIEQEGEYIKKILNNPELFQRHKSSMNEKIMGLFFLRQEQNEKMRYLEEKSERFLAEAKKSRGYYENIPLRSPYIKENRTANAEYKIKQNLIELSPREKAFREMYTAFFYDNERIKNLVDFYESESFSENVKLFLDINGRISPWKTKI